MRDRYMTQRASTQKSVAFGAVNDLDPTLVQCAGEASRTRPPTIPGKTMPMTAIGRLLQGHPMLAVWVALAIARGGMLLFAWRP